MNRDFHPLLLQNRKALDRVRFLFESRSMSDMGVTIESLKVKNSEDVFRFQRGEIPEHQIRGIEVPAIIDTGANHVGLHRAHIDYLGLNLIREVDVLTGGGTITQRVWGNAEMRLLDRWAHGMVLEHPDEVPVVVGFYLLEVLDLLVDPGRQRVFGVPDRPQTAWLLRLNPVA